MQTHGYFSGLHNCLDFSQPSSSLDEAMWTRKKVLYCLNKPHNELMLKLSLSSLFTPGSCNDLDLGIGSGSIPDGNITSSSVESARTPAKNGRLGYSAGSSWCAEASDPSPYLQINLQTLHVLCAVSTQGNSQADEWVETYTLQSSTDGSNWSDYYDEAGQVKVKCKLVYIWTNVVEWKSSIWVQ